MSAKAAIRVTPARSAILDRVRRAQRTGYIPSWDSHHAIPDLKGPGPESSTRSDGSAGKALSDAATDLAKFLGELKALGVDHYVESSDTDVRSRVLHIVGNKTAFCWTRDQLPYGAGAAISNMVTGASPRDQQAAAEIGVTGCDAAIAETGSLVMLSAPGRPRAASLLPPIHLCLVRRGDLRSSMGQFFAERADAIAAAACCTFITGPSRTADIELTLTLGVHGPGKVIVIVGP